MGQACAQSSASASLHSKSVVSSPPSTALATPPPPPYQPLMQASCMRWPLPDQGRPRHARPEPSLAVLVLVVRGMHARPSAFAAGLASLPFIGSDLGKRDKNRILT